MMYRVLVVDDELFVRIGLKSAIDWEKHGFALMGDAPNGGRAMEMIAEEPPDIVITDIKMPGMDGNQLIREIAAKYPSIQFIVLSNYGDFEYVREAMKNGAVDYFLKAAVDPEKLMEALESCRKKIDMRRDAEQANAPGGTDGRVKPAGGRKTVSDLLAASPSAGGSGEEAASTVAAPYPSRGCVVAVKIREFEQRLKTMVNCDPQSLSRKVMGLAEELVRQNFTGEAYEHEPGSFVCLIESEHPIPAEKMRWLAERVQSSINLYFNLEASVFYGMRFNSAEDLKTLLSELNGIMKLDFYEEEGALLPIGTVSFSKEGMDLIYQKIKKEIGIQIKMNDCAGLVSAFGEFLDEVKKARLDPGLAENTAALVLNYLRDLMIQHGIETVDSVRIDAASRLSFCEFFSELKGTCDDVLTVHIQALREAAGEDFRVEIQKVMEHIHRNYPSRITLEGMAKLISMNKSYFCRLFKKETGENFQNYLIRIRMERAKELLETSEDKIETIAREVGYNDISYFNHAFKQYYRMSPGEYKRNLGTR